VLTFDSDLAAFVRVVDNDGIAYGTRFACVCVRGCASVQINSDINTDCFTVTHTFCTLGASFFLFTSALPPSLRPLRLNLNYYSNSC